MTDLLQIIAGRETQGWLEVRWFPNDKTGPRQDWFALDDLKQAAIFTTQKAPEADVFVGAAVRQIREGGKSATPLANALWTDCDTPESVLALAKFRPLPTLVIRSGSGANVHAWWALGNPAPARYIEQANRRLAHALGADPRCAEVARILRPPGTLNWKTRPPGKVEVVAGTGRAYPLLMVADLPDPPGVTVKRIIPPRVRTDDPLLGISAVEYVQRLTGREVDGRGMVQCPWHKGGQERTPSFMCYPDASEGFHCFGCGLGGDIYTFASRLWGVSRRGAEFVQLRERLERDLL